jgi:hypothetical protein
MDSEPEITLDERIWEPEKKRKVKVEETRFGKVGILVFLMSGLVHWKEKVLYEWLLMVEEDCAA